MTIKWLDYANKRDLTARFPAKRNGATVNAIILHVTAGGATSPYGFFKSSGRNCSHLWVGYSEGLTEQFLPFDSMSYCETQGGRTHISIETASPVDGSGTWNAYQTKMITRIIKDLTAAFNVPVKIMANTMSRGVAYHRIGVKGNFPKTGMYAGYNQRGGSGNYWSSAFGKVCPGNGRIDQMQGIVDAVNGSQTTPNVPVVPTPTPTPSKPSTAYTGPSIVDYLNSVGKDSSYSARARLATDNGIKGYKGTAAQNTKLLKILRGQTGGGTTTQNKGYTGPSIVDYLNSVGKTSTYSARASLAKYHGITGYKGTATQNTKLLKILRGF